LVETPLPELGVTVVAEVSTVAGSFTDSVAVLLFVLYLAIL